MLPGKLPRRPTRDPVSQNPHLQFSDPAVNLKGRLLGTAAVADLVQEQLQGLGPDRVRRHELMPGIDGYLVVDQMQKGPSVDHVARHGVSVGAGMAGSR